MTTRTVVEQPNIVTQTKSFYPPRTNVEHLALVEKARENNLHETSKTQCVHFRHKVQTGTKRNS